ncbi:MAG: adenosylcobinamide-phosphate synthase CbiB [Mariprofundaceae bacterium]|nr:adenosylcobinamide-phosphate synthase CbiB [Mariprofundaceae bacterium]
MILALALFMELVVGDPANRWHPVAWFGRWAGWCESFLYADDQQRGVIAWLCVIAVPLCLLWIGHALFGWLFDALLLWLSIGWKSLFEHVNAVLQAVRLEAVQQAVRFIVSRDTADMDMADVRRAALESLAENASDAVVAPLFWFALLGPLGAGLYRMINTLDAMWGYRNPRYQNFGWWAAKTDDAANWLAARITARLMLWVGKSANWNDVKAQATTHASPNAGWPEAALAFAADVQLGGPVMRGGVIDDRPFYGQAQARDIDGAAAFDALTIVRNTLLLATGLAFGAGLVC